MRRELCWKGILKYHLLNCKCHYFFYECMGLKKTTLSLLKGVTFSLVCVWVKSNWLNVTKYEVFIFWRRPLFLFWVVKSQKRGCWYMQREWVKKKTIRNRPRLEFDKICQIYPFILKNQQRNYFLFVAIAMDKFSKLSPFLFTAFSFMKDSGKGSDSIYFIGRGACQDWERYILMVVKICHCTNGIF